MKAIAALVQIHQEPEVWENLDRPEPPTAYLAPFPHSLLQLWDCLVVWLRFARAFLLADNC